LPLKEGQIEQREMITRHRRKDGTVYDADVHLQMSSLHGKPVFVAVALDITERVEQERRTQQLIHHLQRTNEELDRFAYVASHDLRAPLRAISHLTEWLTEDLAESLPASSREHLELIRQRINRMEGLLNGLLLYARTGREEDLVEQIELQPLVSALMADVSLDNRFELDLDFPISSIRTCRSPLESVLRNLISNAVFHHDRDSGVIRVATRDAGEFVEFSVVDDGPGISEEYREKVFEIFQTLRPRDEVDTTGMGLAIIKKLVELRDGKIWIESVGERGTCVRFTWPKLRDNSVSATRVRSAVTSHGRCEI
ncbi:MAG: ATP-binding protein, partial [Planctomycetales bacterium]|nr:ATP-binding protein [Planctomycetales bacterium]